MSEYWRDAFLVSVIWIGTAYTIATAAAFSDAVEYRDKWEFDGFDSFLLAPVIWLQWAYIKYLDKTNGFKKLGE